MGIFAVITQNDVDNLAVKQAQTSPKLRINL